MFPLTIELTIIIRTLDFQFVTTQIAENQYFYIYNISTQSFMESYCKRLWCRRWQSFWNWKFCKPVACKLHCSIYLFHQLYYVFLCNRLNTFFFFRRMHLSHENIKKEKFLLWSEVTERKTQDFGTGTYTTQWGARGFTSLSPPPDFFSWRRPHGEPDLWKPITILFAIFLKTFHIISI